MGLLPKRHDADFLPNERLKVGVEMNIRISPSKTHAAIPTHFFHRPTVAWKPTRANSPDVSPLFGCTEDSPVVDVFVAFSWLFGGEGAKRPKRPCPRGFVTTPALFPLIAILERMEGTKQFVLPCPNGTAITSGM